MRKGGCPLVCGTALPHCPVILTGISSSRRDPAATHGHDGKHDTPTSSVVTPELWRAQCAAGWVLPTSPVLAKTWPGAAAPVSSMVNRGAGQPLRDAGDAVPRCRRRHCGRPRLWHVRPPSVLGRPDTTTAWGVAMSRRGRLVSMNAACGRVIGRRRHEALGHTRWWARPAPTLSWPPAVSSVVSAASARPAVGCRAVCACLPRAGSRV